MPSTRVCYLVSGLVLLAIAPGVMHAAVIDTPSPKGHDAPQDPDGNVTIYRADDSLSEDVASVIDLRQAKAAGRLYESESPVPGDLLVLKFRSPRITTAFASTTGQNATTRFFSMVNETGIDIGVERRDHGHEHPVTELDLRVGTVEVHHDRENSTFWMLVDTAKARLVLRHGGDPVPRDLAFAELQAVVEIPRSVQPRRYLTGPVTFNSHSVTMRSPDSGVHLDALPATVEKEAGSFHVNGSSTLVPGSNLTVRAVEPGGTALATQRIETRDGQTPPDTVGDSVFNVTLSIGLRHSDDEFDLVVTHEGDRIHEQRVVVGKPPALWNATAERVEDGDHAGDVEVSATLRLPDTGFFYVYVEGYHVATPVPDGESVQTSLFVSERAIGDDGEVHAFAAWDRTGDGELDDDDTLFRSPRYAGTGSDDGALDVGMSVDGRHTQTPTPTSSSTPTPTESPRAPMTTPTATPSPPYGASTPTITHASTPSPTDPSQVSTQSSTATDLPTSVSGGTGTSPSEDQPTPSTPGFGYAAAIGSIVLLAFLLRNRT